MRGASPIRGAAFGGTLLCLMLPCGTARAEVRAAPGADGSFGAWLLAGPLGPGSEARLDEADPVRDSPAGGAAKIRWRLAWSRSTGLDVAAALGAGKKEGPRAALGGVLSLERDLDGWLLLSVDGGVRVSVDGKVTWERDVARLRGASWDAVPLRLSAGRHRLLCHLHHRGDWWAVALRVVERSTLLPPPGLALVLPGTDGADQKRLDDGLLDLSAESGLGAGGYVPRVTLSAPRGAPQAERRVTIRAQVEGASAPLFDVAAGALRGDVPLTVTLPRISAEELGDAPQAVTLELRVGSLRRTHVLTLSGSAVHASERATTLIAGADLPEADRETLRATLDQRRAELSAAGAGPSDDRVALTAATTALQHACTEATADAPLVHRPGVHDLALRSKLDGEPERLVVQVPAGYRRAEARRYPLAIVLHGLGSNGTRVMRAFLDSDARAPRVDGFVVAPQAFGDAFYRGVGETAVIEALDWALATYPIDPARVTITGVSMGGTGAAHVALRYAARFAAAAPLCGYHSFFIRKDVKDRAIRPWETDLMHHFSPASWVASGRNLPLYVAQGTQDYPHENGKTLIEAYRKAGFRVTEEWPEIGHNVHEKVWDGAQQWPWLASARRDPSPSRVSLVTDSLRYGSLHFLHVARLLQPGHAGTADARVAATHRVTVSTDGVAALSLDRGGRIDAVGNVSVYVDGTDLAFDAGEALALHRDAIGAAWQKGPTSAGPHDRRPFVEGPIGDLFLGPVTFVWGAGDRATARVNHEVAEALARRFGAEVRFPIVADTAVSDADLAGRALVLVGTPRDHRILAAVSPDLPIRVDGAALIDGARRFESAGVGAAFVQPDPRDRSRLLLVVTGVDVPGVLRALSLPALLPDYLVYDADLAPAAAQQVLGPARVLAGGFFRQDWSPTPDDADPIAAQP